MIENILWLGHGSFSLQGSPLIFINPWRMVRRVFHPDIILVGHDHYEHCSPADITKLRGPDTLILSNDKVAEEIEGCTVLRPWQSVTVGKARITGIPAYSPDGLSHPKKEGGLGFLISLNLFDIYYAGDTGKIPEMAHIKPDIAILPIDGNGTMTVFEAAEVVKEMRPKWAIPSNIGNTSESASLLDAQAFKKAVGHHAEVIIPELTR